LAQLERRLGVRLLNRTTRRLSLTPEGERYLEEGGRIQRDMEALERSLVAGSAVPHGLLRIHATFGFGRRHLAPAVSDFHARYPAVEVVLHLSDRPLDLTTQAMDISIQFGEPPDRRVLARRIATNRRLLCAAPTYLARRPPPGVPRDLQSHDCIVIRESNSAYNNWQLTDGVHQELVKVRGPLSTNMGEIAVDWALAGHGIVLRSEWDIAPYLRDGRLQRVLPLWEGTLSDIHAIYPQRHQLSSKVRVFLDFLSERFADQLAGHADFAVAW
jgi:DNA-binding transcriptional LysR family regulator